MQRSKKTDDVAIGAYWTRVRGMQRNAKLYLVCSVLQSMTMALSSLLYNLFLTSMGFDAAFIGLNSAATSGARLVCAIPAGTVADRIGRKRSLIAGLTGMTLSQFGLALFSPGWLILVSNVLSGVFGALFVTSVAPFLTENSRGSERALLFVLDSSLMNVASFIAATGGGYLPGLFGNLLRVGPESIDAYRAVMVLAACTMALALLPILMVQDGQRTVSRYLASGFSWRFWQRLSSPMLLLKLVLPRALMAFGAGLVFPFLNLFFKDRFAVSDATLGWIFGINNILAAMVMLWGGAVAERLGKIRAMFFARLLSVPGLLVVGFVPSLPLVVLAHWARSGLMRLGDPLYMAFAMEHLGEDERATGSSLLSTGWNVGWAMGPYVSGLLLPSTGWGALFVGTVVFYSLSLACVYSFFVRGRSAEQLANAEG
jgi:MFS family permease